MQDSGFFSVSTATLLGSRNVKERIADLESQMIDLNNVHTSVVQELGAMTHNKLEREKAIKAAVAEMEDKFRQSMAEFARLNTHRFSLQDSETKKFENQLLTLKSEQNETVWAIPDIMHRIVAIETELGVVPPAEPQPIYVKPVLSPSKPRPATTFF